MFTPSMLMSAAKRPPGTGGGGQRVEVLPGEADHSAAGLLGGPGLHRQGRVTRLRGKAELLARPRGLHDLPLVPRRSRGVDDDRARRPLAGGQVVLVVPAAVVQAGLSPAKGRGGLGGAVFYEEGPSPWGPPP